MHRRGGGLPTAAECEIEVHERKALVQVRLHGR